MGPLLQNFTLFRLRGDALQIATQERLLHQHGIEVIHEGGCRRVKNEHDYKLALQLFHQYLLEGWSNYREDLITYGIFPTEGEVAAEIAYRLDEHQSI
jgi:hypothetical protein